MSNRPSTRLAIVLVAAQWLVSAPGAAMPQASRERAPAPPVKVNKTPPRVSPAPLLPVFSATPTQAEIMRARVFAEPLVAVGGSPSDEENRALAQAITAYVAAGQDEALGPFEAFLAAHPRSPWRAPLLTNLGVAYRRTGYFTRALTAWEEAWTLTKTEQQPNGQAVADHALGELAELSGRLGRYERLEALFAEIEGRDVRGSATEKIAGARHGLWLMRNKPEDAFRCGPMALDRLLAYGRAEYRRSPKIAESRSTLQGMSLTQVQALAHDLGMRMQVAKRERGASPIVPAVVHWRAGHFAALVAEHEGRYLVQDPTFGDEIWVSRAALDDEGSGYALVPEEKLPSGWRAVPASEGADVWGKGNTTTLSAEYTGGGQPNKAGGGECKGMAGYTVNAMLVSLYIQDTPLAYSPALGPGVSLHLSYNQRDAFQPQIFSYGNVGQKWTFDWLAYIEDSPSNPSQSVKLYRSGGGQETYTGFNAATQSYAVHYRSQALVVRTNSNPIRYERRLRDGSTEVFSQPDGAQAFPRKVFLTAVKDPQGHGLEYTYDASLRLVAVTDELDQVTTVSYEHPSDPLKITRVTDPFGRSAMLEYDASGRLWKITDVLGIVSQFGYAAADFISTLTTPYGTTSFVMAQSGLSRFIEITDPTGARERVEYQNHVDDIPGTDPPATVPAGFANFALAYRNTFFWDKRAMALHPGDYAKAEILHWLHDVDLNVTAGILESEKRPLENRVWYGYKGQTQGWTIGSSALLAKVARVLDNGTTQLRQYEYNARGMKIREIDPAGRETVHVYGANNVPDANPATGSGLDMLQVKVKNTASPGGWDVTASYTYNSQHQPLTVTDAAGQTTTYTYTVSGQLETVTTPPRAGITENRTTTYTYDPVTGNVASVTGPGGTGSSSTYDDYGRVRTSTDIDGYTLTYDYDVFDRPIRTTYPDGTYEETQYDRLDAARRRDRLGRWSHTFYDWLRRVAQTRDAQGRTVRQVWCNCGSLERLIDPNGNATTWEHDQAGRVTKEIRANGSFKTTVYETTTSRLKKVIDAKLQETQYTYAVDDKLLSVTYVNAEHPTPNVTYSYTDPATGATDAHGRIRQVVDGTGTTVYAYHPFGQLGAGQVASVDGPLANDTITYAYDELGRLVTRTLNGVTTTWSYDALGRLTTTGDPIGAFTYGYVGSTGRVSNVTYPNGQTSDYAYYPVAQDLRLQEIQHRRPGGATLNKFTYTYDAVGNIRTWGQQTDGNPPQTYTYEYDRVDQLTAATLAAPTPKRYRYAYDPAGNRTVEQIDDMATTSTYDDMNRLVSQAPGGPLAFRGTLNEAAITTVGGKLATGNPPTQFSGTGVVPPGSSQVTVQATDGSGNVRTNTYGITQTGSSKSFTYDANGNLIGDGVKTYEWDAASRLLGVKQGQNALASFTYDANGRRASKAAGGFTTTFVYDGAQFLEDRLSGGARTRYVYGAGIDQVLAQNTADVTSYFVADHLGSVVRVADAIGSPALTREYDPWGNLLQGAAVSGYAFTGREWDSEISLHYYRARYYDPLTARFLVEDPDGLTAGVNLLSYVQNRPTVATDSSGRRAELRCRTIKRSGRDIPGVHCYLFVKCQEPDDGTDSGGCLMGYLFPTYIFEDYLSTAPPTHGDVASSLTGTYSKHHVYGSSSPALEKCLVEKGRQWANQYIINYRGVRGPNSNTYVHWLLSACGADSAAPGPAFGWEKVPGWSPGLTPDASKRGGASDF